jgi:hypothetical protein
LFTANRTRSTKPLLRFAKRLKFCRRLRPRNYSSPQSTSSRVTSKRPCNFFAPPARLPRISMRWRPRAWGWPTARITHPPPAYSKGPRHQARCGIRRLQPRTCTV